jgi:hypothetical protein
MTRRGAFFGPLEEGSEMRRFLIVFVLVVAGFVGLGFYQGWFRLSAGGTDGKANIPVTVDKDKIEQDKAKAKEKVQDLEQKVKEKTKAGTDGTKEGAPRP